MDDRQLFGLVLGATIAQQRSRTGWTQERLAERVGVSQSMLSRFEAGLQPNAFQLGQLATAFGMTAGELHALVEKRVAATRRVADALVPGSIARASVEAVSGLVAFVVAQMG